MDDKQKKLLQRVAGLIIFIVFFINPILSFILGMVFSSLFNNKDLENKFKNFSQLKNLNENDGKDFISLLTNTTELNSISNLAFGNNTNLIEAYSINQKTIPKIELSRKKKFLHIALNSTLEESEKIAKNLNIKERVLVEVGTPLIKVYGTKAITRIKNSLPRGSYVIADSKCSDMAGKEVQMMFDAGANAVTCLGISSIETLDTFIAKCEELNIDSMIDMMGVEYPLIILKKLKKLPKVVILHRGVDETNISKFKLLPYYQIKQIKGAYNNVLIAVAGGDTLKEIKSSIFNGADIVTVWKDFYDFNQNENNLVEQFLKQIK